MFSESKKRYFLFTLIGSAILNLFFGYFLDRTDFLYLISAYSLLFFLYIFQLNLSKSLDLIHILVAAVFFRLLFLFSMPGLSDDIYRFIWDGLLWQSGINPFEFTPREIINSDINIRGIDHNLYQKLNSPDYFTVYPPFHQLIFYLSTLPDPDNLWLSVLIHRFGIFIAEMISIIAILKILRILNLPENRIAIFALNPLIIIELSGNLHYEAWLIAFLLLSILFLLQGRKHFSSLFFSLSVITKLWPLMFLPTFFGKMKNMRVLLFYASVFFIVLMSFLMVFDLGQIQNMAQSVDLYFRKFEFNASVFYVIRALGFLAVDYDIVQTAGPILAIVTFMLILGYSYMKRKENAGKITEQMMWIFFLYLLMSTTVHPWYISVLIALCAFGNFRFPLLWSWLVMLSYFAYSQEGWKESYLLISLEYIFVLIFLILEWRNERKESKRLLAFLP